MRRIMVALLWVISGCASSLAPTKGQLQRSLRARVVELSSVSTSPRAFSVQVQVEVFNPRAEAVHLDRIEYILDTATLAGKLGGALIADDVLESEQAGSFAFVVDVPFGEQELLHLEDVSVAKPASLSGVVVLGDGTKAAFAQTGLLSLPVPLKWVFESVRAYRADKAWSEIRLHFVASLHNPNPFSIFVRAINFVVEVEGVEVGEQVMTIDAAVEAEQALSLDRLVGYTINDQMIDLTSVRASRLIKCRVSGAIITDTIKVAFGRDAYAAVE